MSARTPEECDALFERYLNAGDIDALVELYEPEACFVQQEGTTVHGKPAIREQLAGFIAMKPVITMHVSKSIKTGDDLCVLYNDWSLTATGPDGSDVAMNGKAIEIVRRQANGTWLFAIDDPNGRN